MGQCNETVPSMSDYSLSNELALLVPTTEPVNVVEVLMHPFWNN